MHLNMLKPLANGLFLISLFATINVSAQLTFEQKRTDFQALVALYNTQYGPYEWKVNAFNFDLLNVQPWLQQVDSARDDLEFDDVCVRYIASLQDAHDEFILPSLYEAYLPILADVYDDHVLIDYIDRTALPSQTYPFAIGDELISVDGKSVDDWIADLGPYAANGQGNPVSRKRLAVATMLDRYQGFYTFSNQIQAGDTATILVMGQDGSTKSYSMPWSIIGLALNGGAERATERPHAILPKTAFELSPIKRSMRELQSAAANSWRLWAGALPVRKAEGRGEPLNRLRKFDSFSVYEPDRVLAGGLVPFNSKIPAFNPPAGFHLRLGGLSTDEFVSGTFMIGQLTVGFIRIPSFSPANQTKAVQQFQSEIIYFEQNTGGLVVDLMGNGGGNLCYANRLVQFLSPQPFQGLSFQVRASKARLLSFEDLLISEQFNGGSQSDIDAVTSLIDEVQQAMTGSGLTHPIQAISPVTCNGNGGFIYPPAMDAQGHNIAYTKPILVLTDNFTFSAAEMFAAVLQDQKRVSVYGSRTNGGGGNVEEYDWGSGPYSEGRVRLTESIAVRKHNISTPGLPSGPYIENIGIQPDVPAKLNTRSNLLTGGQAFVNGFSTVITEMINGSRHGR